MNFEQLRIKHSPLEFPKKAVDCYIMLSDTNRILKIYYKRKRRFGDKGEFRDDRIWEIYKGDFSTIHNISRAVVRRGKHYVWR